MSDLESSTRDGAAVGVQRLVSRRIQRAADQLGLKITNYQGFVRGGWIGDGDRRPCGMWVFSVEAADTAATDDHEPVNIVADTIDAAIDSMREWGEYLFG